MSDDGTRWIVDGPASTVTRLSSALEDCAPLTASAPAGGPRILEVLEAAGQHSVPTAPTCRSHRRSTRRILTALTFPTGPGHPRPAGGRAPFSSGCTAAPGGADGHLSVAEIRSPSPLAVSRGRSVIGRGPSAQPTPAPDCAGRVTLSAYRNPAEALAPAARGRKPGSARRGLFGIDRPPSPIPRAPSADRRTNHHTERSTT